MITLKRYSNRKIYYSEKRRYVNLQEIEDIVLGGDEVRVIQYDTNSDYTARILTGILAKKGNKLGIEKLVCFIRYNIGKAEESYVSPFIVELPPELTSEINEDDLDVWLEKVKLYLPLCTS